MKAAPLPVSFRSIEKYLEALPEKQRSEYSEEIQRLADQGYPPVTSPYCLAVLFGYSLGFVYSLSTRQFKYYRTFEIRNGRKKRKIHAPRVALKAIQKWIGCHLAEASDFSPHVCGFVKGRSFAGAARQHIGAKWVYSIDVVDFFPSISRDEISKSLLAIGYSEQACDLIADLCCLNGGLAQGSPASPVLSNIYMKNIDNNLLVLAKKYNSKITRYADDIVFSGVGSFDSNLKEELELLFENCPLKLNKGKTYFADAEKGQRLKVHGLLVKEEKVALTKGYRNKLRAYQHMLKAGKICEKDIPRISGHVKFSEYIEAVDRS